MLFAPGEPSFMSCKALAKTSKENRFFDALLLIACNSVQNYVTRKVLHVMIGLKSLGVLVNLGASFKTFEKSAYSRYFLRCLTHNVDMWWCGRQIGCDVHRNGRCVTWRRFNRLALNWLNKVKNQWHSFFMLSLRYNGGGGIAWLWAGCLC